MGKTQSLMAFALFAFFIVGSQGLFIVRQTEQVMVMQFGNPVEKYTEAGLKVKMPFIQAPIRFEKRVLDVDPPAEEVILSDQKRLVVDTFARYSIVDMEQFYKAVGTEESANLRLSNIITSSTKSVLASVTMSDILSEKRLQIMNHIRDQVNKSVENLLGVRVIDVRIGRADLPQQTSQSVFARMRTEREREAAEFRAQGQEQAQEIRSKADKERTILLATAEKQAQIDRGKGDETAIKTYADAFKRDPEFYNFYRSMEAYKHSFSGDSTTMLLAPDNGFLKYLKGSTGK